MKTFSLKKLSHAIALTTAATLPVHANHVEKRIGDLEIYEAATGGGASVLLMLDNSGSMNYRSIEEDYRSSYYYNCKGKTGGSWWQPFTYPKVQQKHFFFNIKKDDGTIGERVDFVGYHWPSCGDQKTYHDRMTRVKDAIITLLADPAKELGADYMKYKIGLGNFYYAQSVKNSGGQIAYPISTLTYNNRLALAKKIANLQANTLTPTAHAYAESGAYMLGTKTGALRSATNYTLMGYRHYNGGKGAYLTQCTYPPKWEDHKSTDCLGPVNFEVLSEPLLSKLGVNHREQKRDYTYYYRKETEYKNTTAGSGFSLAHPSAVRDGNYVSPVTSSQCDGHGIYFLTDGEPNGGSYHGVDPSTTTTVMNNALDGSAGSVSMPAGSGYGARVCTVGNGESTIRSTGAYYAKSNNSSGHPQWECIGEFAKALASDRNKVGKPIPTATVGFGKVFESASQYKREQTVTNIITGEQSVKQVHNCSKIPDNFRDAKNLCYLGERGHGYGEGGFYYAESSDDVAKSVIDFVTNVSGNISASPAGTVAVPTDPLSITSLQPYAYLPMLQADVAEAPATWPGNLKKYHTINGSLYGKDKTTRLYQKTGGSTLPYATNPKAQDLWQTNASTDGAITTGGTYAHLTAPTKSNKSQVRTVYVEDGNQMKKVGVKDGRLEGFDQLSSQYGGLDKAYILHYLGFGSVSTTESTYNGNSEQQHAALQRELNKDPTGRPVMGGIHHSVPALVAYKGQFDNTGNISSTQGREDYVLYGSMSGALLMANAKTGDEKFSFIPYKMFKNKKQRAALSPSGTGISGEPVFGVDAPWTINAKYNYDFSTQPAKITTEAITKSSATSAQSKGHIYAYGGLRMGGKGLYGLDLTDKDKPDMLFSIDDQTPGFERMGQIWAKPVVAKIKIGTDAKGGSIDREVLIFGGGYDMCYESTLFKLKDGNRANTECANKQVTQGNAVYMVDSETGDLVASWTKDKTINGNQKITNGLTHMKHSVVGGITALDRNNNGYVDHLYFADLGGQLFRIDLIELSGQNHNKKDEKDITNDITRGVVRVFDANANANANGNMANSHVPYRFYEAPVVSFYTNPDDAQRFAVINLASGDRSSPLSRRRDLGDANRVYGIIDRDITSARVTNAHISAEALMSKDLNSSHLQKMDTKEIEKQGVAYRETLIKPMRDKKPNAKKEVRVGSSTITLPVYEKMGWYYDMIRYDGHIDVKNLKAVGPGMVTGGVYYNSVYSPDFQYGNAGQCEARIVGATERQMYCMPWGVCPIDAPNKPSKNGTLGYAPAGIGIQELTTVPYTSQADKTTNLRTFLSIQTVQERAEMANKTKTPSHGVGGADGRFVDTAGTSVNNRIGFDRFSQPQIDREQYNLKVNRWYDFQNVER